MTQQSFGFYADLSAIKFSDAGYSSWLHAMKPGKYLHPVYGELDLSKERLQKFADSVQKNVRGIPLDIDYDHKEDKARGSEAAGWVKQAEVRDTGLWLFVDWTQTAASKIKEKAFRFFSPEFHTEWTDAQGVKHTDVLFGGGITNRPFLKNLLPLNLSELTFDNPPVNPDPNDKGEKEVDLKKLAEILGLPADSAEDVVYAKLGERLTPTPPPVVTPPVQLFELPDSLKQLAETNPAMQGLVTMMEGLITQTKADAAKLREVAIVAKLNEFDNSTVVLTPAAKELAYNVATQLNEDTLPKFWELMTAMRNGNSLVVELGERGKAGVGFSREKSAEVKFNEATDLLVKGGMAYADAVERVAKDNPQLYTEYRNEVHIVKA